MTEEPLIARIVRASCDRAWVVVMIAVVLSALAAAYTTERFAMTTDSLQLISPDLPWRRNKASFDAAFPQQGDLIVVVVDAATPELAERGAGELAARLSLRPELFRSIRRPDGGAFFERNGLLFLPVADVAATMNELIAAQAFLGPMAADPSLRGVIDSLGMAVEGVRHDEVTLEKLGRPLAALADSLERVVDGQPAFFSWRMLISDQSTGRRETRRILLAQPRLDNGLLAPGAQASNAIRRAARDLHLDPENGVSIRLTGSVALADEEFSTLADGAGLMSTLVTVAVLSMLWLAVRTVRIVACILLTTLAGLVLTAALGLLAVGRFNLISVAFIPLFVGLGIDFAIQFSVRFRSERRVHLDLKDALAATGAAFGSALALAAAAMAAGFLAFLPTAYLGASELGLIAGIGMGIAFLLSITLLPALLFLARPRGGSRVIGFAALAPLDRYLMIRRKPVLVLAGCAAAACLALLPQLRFDFNPLHLRSPRVESMATLMDLTSDPDRTPNTIDVLAPSLAAGRQLADRISALPEVAHAVTLSSFVPIDQPEKLRLIADASMLLDVTLNPIDMKPPPTDAETARSLALTANDLRQAAGDATTLAANDARRLASVLDRLAGGSAALREQAARTLLTPLAVVLEQMRAMLQAAPVTLRSLTSELEQDWVAADGRARIQVFPAGDSNDNRTLRRFADAVRTIAPDATGPPISIQEAARTVVNAFLQAGISSFLAITAMLALVLRRVRDVIMTLLPILLTALLTVATCVVVDRPLNFANIIALPLLLGIGVAFNIYFVAAWRSGEANLLESSLARAVLFSALTTAAAFGSLWLSSHPGMAGLGELLVMSLGWTIVTAFFFEPALLGPPRRGLRTRAVRPEAPLARTGST